MKHGSLFSGIGGFDLASDWMGWDNVFHCEIESFPRKILHHYWPSTISYEDIKKTDFSIHKGGIDILTGGFPCQPYSMAGKRKGKEDERHLWPEMLRAIREIQPRWIVGENVFGLVNWNDGLVFDEVQSDLEAEGYEVQTYILPAAAVGAPHRRDRVWIVAYSNNNRHCTRRSEIEKTNGIPKINREEMGCGKFNGTSILQNSTNTKNIRPKDALENAELERGRFRFGNKLSTWDAFPLESPICGGDDGLPTKLDGITFPKWRNESIKGYGNAIVPQVVYQIFKAIQEYEILYNE